MRARKGRIMMTRRSFMQASAGYGLYAALAARGQAAGGAVGRPNVLLLMDDQHRGDCLGADGNQVVQTPNLDRLAQEGACFRQAYSSTPTCTPARAALLTGMSPWRHGMLGYGKIPEKLPVEMPKLLRDAGYYTLGIGKMHYHPQRNLHGFHETILDESGRVLSPEFRSDYRAWFQSVAPTRDPDVTGISFNSHRAAPFALPEELHPTRWTADVACEFLKHYADPAPFFLKVSFARPHSPYDPPQRWWDRYADADLPPARVGKWAERYRERSDDTEDLWHGDLGAALVRRARQGYYGSVSYVDEQVGRVIAALDACGQLENTLILFCSDHGDMTGDHHLWRKSYAYDASARIPMIVRWPKGLCEAPRGQHFHQPVEIRDILPTFLDAAAASSSVPLDGRSLLEIVRGKAEDWRVYIDLEHDICYGERNHWNALTDGKMKYIFHAFDGEEQLFDLTADPHELNDLAGVPAHAEALRLWRTRLAEHFAVRGDAWVKDGKPVLRPMSVPRSPHYPVTVA
jgi:arylsulfatase